MSILLEQYKGAFPTWLAPVQIKLIPVFTFEGRSSIEIFLPV